MIISRRTLLRMGNVSGKSCGENRNKHFTFQTFFPENRAVYELMWKNMLQPDRPPMTLGPMRFSCCLRKGTNTHSEYVILIAHPQKWLRQRAWMLRYTCTAWHVSLRKDLKSLTLFTALIYRLKELSPPFLLLGSTSHVRDILQYSFVSMLFRNGSPPPPILSGIFRFFFGFTWKFILYCINVVVSVSCCRITIYSFCTVQ